MTQESPERKILKIFLASPGDVENERGIVLNTIDNLNNFFRDLHYQVHLKKMAWEISAHSGPGKAQDVINKQIAPSKSDIFIAILWKRFGTPTNTTRPDDNSPYLSGTQQEIEDAYNSWKKTGRPIVMVYRKDEPVPADMSKDELAQYTRVIEFFRECEPGGKHPVFVKKFVSEHFPELIQREITQVIGELQASNDEYRLDSETKSTTTVLNMPSTGNLEISKRTSEDPETSAWLQSLGLKANPFQYQDAEDDSDLAFYFSRFPDLQTVTSNDLLRDKKTWFFYGREGNGKTALRKFLFSKTQPNDARSDILGIEYDEKCFQQLLGQVDDVSNFQVDFIRSLYEKSFSGLEISSDNENIEWRNISDLQKNLTRLLNTLQKHSIQRMLCLIDSGKESFFWKGSNIAVAPLLRSILAFPDFAGLNFRFFAPVVVKNELNDIFENAAYNQYRLFEIKWDEPSLGNLIAKRMTAFSSDPSAPYRSIGQLCDDEKDFSRIIDADIVRLAQGNPRAVIWLINRLIEEHCQQIPIPMRIAPETWDKVKMAWWARGESRILGISQDVRFHLLGEKIFYKDSEIVLQGRSHQFLKSFIQAKGGILSNAELIQIGWSGENPDGITQKAISQAILRLKNELSREFEIKQLEPKEWIKSVRGRGYRLIQTGTDKSEGK
jgi:DNA-binding winged helix-turn-helix (wHTH) protein